MIAFVALTVSSLIGCEATLGNARYKIDCPVINPITGNIATTPDGKVAMAHFDISSGRNMKDQIEASSPGCFSFGAGSLEQGEDRLGPAIDRVTDAVSELRDLAPG